MEKSSSVLFPFLCADCGWTYETNDKLQEHVQQNHMVEYSCSQPDANDQGELAADGEHQRLRLHIKRNFVGATGRSTEGDPELLSGRPAQQRERSVCRKCNVGFISKVLFERHLKAHVLESELAVKVHRLHVPVDVLRDVSNSYANAAADSSPSVSDVGKCSLTDSADPALTMETPLSSELLSRTLLDELSGYMKDVTESILTTPHKGTDSHFERHMTAAEPVPKKAPSLPASVPVPVMSPETYRPSPTRDFSQPPAFPRLCSSPTDGSRQFSPPQTSTSPRNAGQQQHNPPNARPLASAAPAGSTQQVSSVPTSYVNSVPTTSGSYGIRYSGSAVPYPSAGSTVTRVSSCNASQAVSRATGTATNHALTTVAPSHTDSRLGATLAGGQTLRQYGQGQPMNTSSTLHPNDRTQSVTVTCQGQPVQRAVPTSSPGTRRTPPSLVTSAAGRQNLQPGTTASGNPLAMLNQLNLSVSRVQPARPVETNVSVQERPASVIVLENPQENPVPSIHSVVSLHPGYRHESWGNIVVPASEAAASLGAQHIHQNPVSHCQCLACRDIRGGDLLRKSLKMENGRCDYMCPKCKRLFAQKTSFIRHCKTFKHAFICDMCHCGFLTEAPYETHKSLHLMKGLLHGPQQHRPQVPGSQMITANQHLAAASPQQQQRPLQGLPVMGHGQPSVLQQQRSQVPQQRPNPGALKPAVDDADDDVVVLEQASGMPHRKPAPKTYNRSPVQPQPAVVPKPMPGRRVSFVQQSPAGAQQQQKPQTTVQPLTGATPPQISRILNNSELTLTPIARSQDTVPANTVAGLVLQSSANMQLTDNGPQKPVQINVSSNMVGLQPMTGTPKRPAMPNILAKRPQGLSVSTVTSPPANASPGSAAYRFAAPQSYRVLPGSGQSRPGAKPPEGPSSLQMNSMNNRSGVGGGTPLWHHPPARPAGQQVTQRPQALPSSHQSHGPNRYPQAAGQPQAGSNMRYVGSVRLPPPYTQSAPMPTHQQFSQNRPQVRPPLQQMQQAMGRMLPPSQPKERIVKCKICLAICPTVAALQEHFEKNHAQAFQQQHGYQQPQQSNYLQQPHQLQQLGQQPHQMQQLGQQPHQMQQLSQQLQKPPLYSCRRCQKTFLNMLQFKGHETQCNGRVQCMKCNEMVFRSELLSHYSKVHHNGAPLTGFESGPQAEGGLTNRISPNNPVFAVPQQTAAIHPGNSSAVSAGLSETFANQMSVGLEPLISPPPLVRISSVGAADAVQHDTTTYPESHPFDQGTQLTIASVSSDGQYFTNAAVGEGDMPLAIIHSVQSLSEEGQAVPSDGGPEAEAGYEKPLTPVLALVGELVSTVEEECDKDSSLLDEASGLFVSGSGTAEVPEPDMQMDTGSFVEPIEQSEDSAWLHEPLSEDSGDNSPAPPTEEEPPALEAAESQTEDSVPLLVIDSSDEAIAVTGSADAAIADTGSADEVITVTGSVDAAIADTGSANEVIAVSDSADEAIAVSDSADEAIADTGSADEAIADTGSADEAIADTGSADEAIAVSDSVDEADVGEDRGSAPEDDQMEKDAKSPTGGEDGIGTTIEVPDSSEGEDRAAVSGESAGEERIVKDPDDSEGHHVIEVPESSEEERAESPTKTRDASAGSRSESDMQEQNDSDTDTVAMEDDGETSEPAGPEEDKPASCPICDMEFESRAALVEHSHIHLSTAHCCTFCGDSFSSNKRLRNHLRTHLRSLSQPPRSAASKRRRTEDPFAAGVPDNLAVALFDFDKVSENTEYLRRLGIYGFMRFSDMKDFFCGAARRRPRRPPLINLPDDEED